MSFCSFDVHWNLTSVFTSSWHWLQYPMLSSLGTCPQTFPVQWNRLLFNCSLFFPVYLTHDLQTPLVRETWLMWNITTFSVNQDQLDPAHIWPRIEIGKIERSCVNWRIILCAFSYLVCSQSAFQRTSFSLPFSLSSSGNPIDDKVNWKVLFITLALLCCQELKQ